MDFNYRDLEQMEEWELEACLDWAQEQLSEGVSYD